MPTNNTEGVLVYTNEKRGFEYSEGSYKLTGNEVSNNSEIQCVDAGNIQKDEVFIGGFFVRFEGGKTKISLNNVEADEVLAAYGVITNLVAKFTEEN